MFHASCLATGTFSYLHRFSIGLRSGHWLDHSKTLTCLFLSQSFVAFRVLDHCHAGIPTHPIFNVLAEGRRFSPKTVRVPICPPLIQSPWQKNTPPKHNVSTSMFDGGDGVLGVVSHILSPKTWRVKLMPNRSHLTTTLYPVLLWIIEMFSGLYVFFPTVFLVTGFPAALRSLTSSSRVVLGWFHSVLIITETRWGELLRGAPDRGRLAVILWFFHLRIIAPTVVTFSPSCLAMVL